MCASFHICLTYIHKRDSDLISGGCRIALRRRAETELRKPTCTYAGLGIGSIGILDSFFFAKKKTYSQRLFRQKQTNYTREYEFYRFRLW